MDAERIAAVAVEWNALRIRALELRRLRGDEGCEEEVIAEPEVGQGSSPPCWRFYTMVNDGESVLKPRSEWCEPCVRRQAIHEQYRAVVKQRGIAIRRLERLAAPPAEED